MITVYIMTYNEEIMIDFTINHYRKRFPNCNIVLCDNFSTDKTREIANKYGSKIQDFNTNDKIDDYKYLELKNNCWKTADTNWVLVCDADELLDITYKQLQSEDLNGTTIIRSEGYNMVNMEDNLDLLSIKNGVKAEQYNKSLLFNRSKLKEINYTIGCHNAIPLGKVIYSKNIYPLYHYKFLNTDYQIARYSMYASRLSDNNKKFGMGFHYLDNEELIRIHYKNMRDLARNNKVRD